MRLILFFLITMIFSDDLSIWIDMNREIINSKSYLISFNQKNRSVIQNQSYFNLDTNTSVVSFKNQVRYETSDRIVIANKDSIKVLNKKNNQIFIDDIDDNYLFLLNLNLIDILDSAEFEVNDNHYYVKINDSTDLKLYFSDKMIPFIEILNYNMNIELSDISLVSIDSTNIKDYFEINNLSSSIFDLRSK